MFLFLSLNLVLAEDFGYNLIRGQTFNNVTAFVNQSQYWNTGDHGPLGNVADILHSWLDPTSLLWSNAGHTIDTTLDMNSNNIDEVNNIIGEGEVTFTNTNVGVNEFLMNSTNPISLSSFRAETDTGSFAALVSIGSQFPGANRSANDSGIISGGGRLIFVNNGIEDIAFAHVTGGGSNFSNATFTFRLDQYGNAFLEGDLHLEDENKVIKTVAIDGGSAILFEDHDSLVAGGFPFVFIANDSNGKTIVTSWQQNGRNNSYSGQMNSFGTYPKSYIFYTVDQVQINQDNLSALFDLSDYVDYCTYLQDNLSIVDEGCRYFADTTGRLVPLLFGGDLEIHRTATIHEGTTLFQDFDYITRDNEDADFIGGDIHLRKNQNLLENLTDLNITLCDFDDGTLCNFYDTTLVPQVGRQWRNVAEVECHEDRCTRADGGTLKVLCVDRSTVNLTNINFSFWYTLDGSVGDDLNVTLDDNLGNTTTPFTDTAPAVDLLGSFLFPSLYENKSNITICFEWDGQNQIRTVWLDLIKLNAELSQAQFINVTELEGKLILGENADDPDECYIHTLFRLTPLGEAYKVMDLGCPTSQTIVNGSEVTVTSLEGSYTGGSAYVCVYNNGTLYTDETGC